MKPQMSFNQKVKLLLRSHGLSPKKRLGQNFMVDHYLLECMISYASTKRSDVVLEVGAGFGFLTRLLAQKAKKAIAVEKDARIMQILRDELADLENVQFIEGDILKTDVPHFDKVVSNPPFSISSPLLFWLLGKPFETAILTFQKEFAERLAASVGSRNYSRLTVSTYYYAEAELLDDVPKEAFYPMPEVDAVIVRLKPRMTSPFKVKDEEVFREVVRVLFTQRNRRVRKAILTLFRKQGMKSIEAAEKADSLPFKDRRVRDLSPEDFGALADELT